MAEPGAGRGLRAGFAKVEISRSVVGAEMVGYMPRRVAESVNDPLYARAMVLECEGVAVGCCSVDSLHVEEDTVAAARALVAADGVIAPEQIWIAATHTHSGPSDGDRRCWPEGLGPPIAAALRGAVAAMGEATIGVGWGLVQGAGINRRRLEEPVDTALLVLRVDDAAGRPLGTCFGFGCHPVVLGPDSTVVSADWPGAAAARLEAELGGPAMFLQGGCGDVNPLPAATKALLADGTRVHAQVGGIHYHGGDGGEPYAIGDRRGGTYAEVEALGDAVAAEALRVRRGIEPVPVSALWTEQIEVANRGKPLGEPPFGRDIGPRAPLSQPLEIMLIGIEGPGVLLVGQPGEVFSETAIGLRRELRLAGFPNPFLNGYANGWRGYLAPPSAYPDGGYEVDWARGVGLAAELQDEIRAALFHRLGPRAR